MWQEAFGGPGGKPRQYFAAYEEIRKAGISFAARDPTTTVPVFTPPQTTPIVPTSSPNPISPLPGPALSPNSPSPASATATAARRAVTARGGGDGALAGAQQGVPALGGVHLGVPAGILSDDVDAG